MTTTMEHHSCSAHDSTAVHAHSGLRCLRPILLIALSCLLAASGAKVAGAAPLLHGPRLEGQLASSAGPALLHAGTAAAAPAQSIPFTVTQFAGDTVHGQVWSSMHGERRPIRLHAREIVGLTWAARECDAGRCQTVTYRIADAASDTSTSTMPHHGDNSDVWLYRVEYALGSAPGQWHNPCGSSSPDMGILVDGYWSEDGTWHPDGWTFSCPGGVIAKCVRSWGYKPWKTLRSPACGQVGLQPLHQACVRAARAEYCGDGISHTRNGTLIDMFDACGLNVPEHVPGFREESVFDQYGALWVSIPRWPTAAATETGWRFDRCERPRQAAARGAPALIHVWSDPNKGRVEEHE